MKTILVPIDFSRVTESVVTESIALARALKARIVLFHVVQPPVLTAEYAPMADQMGEILAMIEKSAAKNLAKVHARIAAASVSVESVHLTGTPIANIVDHAKKISADYVVMGSHGHTAIYDLLLGSTTHGVMKRVACPVVIVPAPKPGAKTKARKRKR